MAKRETGIGRGTLATTIPGTYDIEEREAGDMGAKDGDTVRVHYRGTLDSGEEFDSSEGRTPLEFTVGSGQVISGFDEAVRGLEPGETKKARLEPEEAYGPRYEDAVQEVGRENFADDPYVGGEVQLISPEGDMIHARIVAFDDEMVTLDFNHPLAGEALTFDVQLLEVLEAGSPVAGGDEEAG